MNVLREFDNTAGAVQNTNQPSVIDIIKKYKFSGEDMNEESGFVIGSNGYVAIQYQFGNQKVLKLRPDNGLALDTNELQKFDADYQSARKLMSELSRIK